MEAHLCSLCSSVVLYPQAQQLEDRNGRLIGFIELNCKTDCNVETLRLRLMGRSKNRASASNYSAYDEQSLQQGSPFQHFLVKDSILFDVHTGERLDLSGPKMFQKGKHIIAYEFLIPATMPSSQDNSFGQVSYEVILFVRGRPSKSFFSMSFTHNPTQSVAIEVHPSPDGIQGMNKVNLNLRQAPGGSSKPEFKANISSNNARMGGCFNLILQHPMTDDQDALKVVDLSFTLEQFWNARGERAHGATLTSIVADMSSFKTDCIEKGQATMATDNSNSEYFNTKGLSTAETSVTTSQASMATPPPYQSNAMQAYSQRIKFHDYFPASSEIESNDGRKSKLNMGWQASTPEKTQDEVRIEHKLTLVVKYVSKLHTGAVTTVTLSTPITLVTETFRSEALQLPEYTTGTVIEPEYSVDPVSNADPELNALMR